MTRKPSIMWRALEVLKEEKRLTTGMLAKKLGVSQPRASQILDALARKGFVRRLTWGMYEYVEDRRDPIDVLKAAMEDIAEVAVELAEKDMLEEHAKLLRAQNLLEEVLDFVEIVSKVGQNERGG